MATLRILRSNPAISDDDLVAALISGTDLNEDEADVIVRIAHSAPTEIGHDGDGVMLGRIAGILSNNGFEVALDA